MFVFFTGTGKTMLAHAIANEMGVPFLSISAPEVVSGMSGESEEKIRKLFKGFFVFCVFLILWFDFS